MNLLVDKTREIIEYFNPRFWCVENPMSRIHKLNSWLGKVQFKFHPYEFAGYSPNQDEDRYKKTTWLWGKFNNPIPKPIEPFHDYCVFWKKLGGKSERTKEIRSKTPLGFAYAFFEVNCVAGSKTTPFRTLEDYF